VPCAHLRLLRMGVPLSRATAARTAHHPVRARVAPLRRRRLFFIFQQLSQRQRSQQ